MRQALPLDESHREISLAIVLTDLIHRDAARLVEVRNGLCFSVEMPHVSGRRDATERLELSQAGQANKKALGSSAAIAA
jgi:hypothetical protein